jgi:hypothetical protein
MGDRMVVSIIIDIVCGFAGTTVETLSANLNVSCKNGDLEVTNDE